MTYEMMIGMGLGILICGMSGYIVFLRSQVALFNKGATQLMDMVDERNRRYDAILDMQDACTQDMINASNLMNSLLSNLQQMPANPEDMSLLWPLKKDEDREL